MANISNSANNTVVSGTKSADSISNTGSYVTISANSGADSIYTDGSRILLKGDSGNDYINVDSTASQITILGGDGDDSVENYASVATINGGSGDDYVNNYSDNVSINGSSGNNTIDINSSSNITVNVNEGSDTIFVGGGNTTFHVQKFTSNDKIQFNYPINTLNSVSNGVVADDITITGIKLSETTSKWTFGKGGVATYSESYPAGVTLTDENALVYRSAKSSNLFSIGNVASTSGLAVDTENKSVTVSAAALNEKNVTISGEYTLELADDVTLTEVKDVWNKNSGYYTYNTSSTVAGYELEDNKIIYTPSSSGEKMIEISGLKSEPTVEGDTVTFSSNNFSSKANVVDNAGNYELEIAEGNYSTKTFNGSSVGDIIRNYGSNISIFGNAGNDYIHNESNTTKVALSGDAGNDILENDSENVTIDGGAGNDSVINLGNNASILGGTGNDTISNTGSNVKIFGNAGSDSIFNEGSSVTVSGGAGSDIITNKGNNVTILGGSDNDSIENTASNILFQYSGGNDVIEGFDSTSTLQLNKSITRAYLDEQRNAIFAVDQSTITLKYLGISTKSINLMDSLGNTSTYTINLFRGTSENDNLANSNSNITIQALEGNDTVDNTASKVTIDGGAGNDLIKNTGSQVLIDGGAGKDSISLNGGISVTVNTDSGDDSIFVGNVSSFSVEKFTSGDEIQLNSTISGLSSINEGILAGNVTIAGLTVSTVTPTWSFAENSAVYSQKYSAGAILSENNKTIAYTPASTTNLFTIQGVTSTEGISVIDTTVIISKSSLSKKTVSITDGYNLSLGDDVDQWYTEPESWSLNDTIATYKDVATVAGYEIVDNKINYVDSVDGATLIEIRGVSSLPTLSGNSVMFSAENFAGNVSVVSNNVEYEFTLNEDDYSGKTFSGSKKGDYIFNSSGSNLSIAGGAGNDTIINNSGGENVSINAGNGNDSVENYADNAIIVAGKGDDHIYNNADNVTIDSGAGNDTIELYEVKTLIKYASGDGNDTITGYSGENISIDLVSGTFGGTSSTEEGNFALQIDENTITFTNSDDELISLKTSEKNYVWNGKDYEIVDAGEGNNAIDNKGSFVTIQSGSGNDTVTLSAEEAGNTFIYTIGSGKDVIYDFTDSDEIKIDDSSKLKVDVKRNDVIFKVNKGSITLKNAAENNTAVTIIDSVQDEVISTDIYSKSGVIKENGMIIELWENFSGKYTATDNISTVDASKVIGKAKITGNEGISNELIGGKRNNTLEGSFADDTLTGGKGSDVFVYTGGNDIITDYAKQDKISVGGSSLAFQDYAIEENDLILSFSSMDSLTITGGAEKAITFVENNKKTAQIYESVGIFDKKKKSVVLSGLESTFNAENYSKLATIDASSVMDSMEIIGNSKSNVISASEFGSTLNGGRGKDTLIGEQSSADVFVYENRGGKDVIENYGANDIISLGSGVTFKDSKFKKDNAVIKFKSGSITVNNAKDVEVTLVSATGNDTIYSNGVFIDQETSIAKVYGSFKGKIDLNEYYATTADASEAKKKISIQGTSGDDSLLGGTGKDTLQGDAGDDFMQGGTGKDILRGGDGNDTLWGGKGNDSLWGDDGDDIFIFHVGEGNDSIADYAESDMIQILNRNGNKAASFTGTFDDNTLTLSVKGGGKVLVTGEDFTTGTTVTINDESKTVREWIR